MSIYSVSSHIRYIDKPTVFGIYSHCCCYEKATKTAKHSPENITSSCSFN